MLKFLQKDIPNNSWITKDNDEKLLLDCQPVVFPLSDEDDLTMKKMIDWVKASQDLEFNEDNEMIQAIGIAAPQIGKNIQMYYILLPIWNEEKKDYDYFEHALVNAKIIAKSTQIIALKNGEGCLSVNKKHEGFVPRSYKIIVKGYDYFQKKEVVLNIRGYEAIVFQHEQDHLENKLYYHSINKSKPFNKEKDWIFI